MIKDYLRREMLIYFYSSVTLQLSTISFDDATLDYNGEVDMQHIYTWELWCSRQYVLG